MIMLFFLFFLAGGGGGGGGRGESPKSGFRVGGRVHGSAIFGVPAFRMILFWCI